ncbi:MAG: hypothetical protein RBU37_00425 [Myxococcota bacterium]|nr:hypothetical protein [Myxococcota bacterium]
MMELLEALCRERAQLKAERSLLRALRKRLERSAQPDAALHARQLKEQERLMGERRRCLKRLLIAFSESVPHAMAFLSRDAQAASLLEGANLEIERAIGLVSTPLAAVEPAERSDCRERLKLARQALRAHRKLLERQEQPLGELRQLKRLEGQLRALRKALKTLAFPALSQPPQFDLVPAALPWESREAACPSLPFDSSVSEPSSPQHAEQRRVRKQRLCKLEPERRAGLCADLGTGFRCEKCGLIGPERYLCRPRPK